MHYRPLGRTGMHVSTMCLGAMMFGRFGNPDHDDCVRIVQRALEAGINFIDTADVYSAGESEEILAKALVGRRDDIILATKCHFPVSAGPFDPRPGPQHLRGAAAATSCGRARTASAVSARTGSTSTRCTAPTTPPMWTRRSAR